MTCKLPPPTWWTTLVCNGCYVSLPPPIPPSIEPGAAHYAATLGHLQTLALHHKAVACYSVVMHASFRNTGRQNI